MNASIQEEPQFRSQFRVINCFIQQQRSTSTGSIDNLTPQEPDLTCFTTITNCIEMASFPFLDDMRTLRMKVDQKAHDLFKEKPGQAPLTVTRIFKTKEKDAKPFEKDRKVLNVSDIQMLRNVRHLLNMPLLPVSSQLQSDCVNTQKESNDISQIFTINQDRSWTTLNTSRGVFEGFMSKYKIMPPLWRYMLTFGRKSEENEFEFPRFGQRRTRTPNSNDFTQGSCKHLLSSN